VNRGKNRVAARLAIGDAGRSLLGMGYLVLFGSIVAYNAFIWLLKNAE